ncbi:hypothetical protein [Marinifilum fragile]|uniref:hypothetical protein n=1 Tax=Marinifilum fragile TaxID=570161 RepID=UPI002AA87590|nr:hypothetical protein [Marinifilum fragile]
MNKIILLLCVCSIIFSCTSRSASEKAKLAGKRNPATLPLEQNVSMEAGAVKPNVKFYLENSGSMFGYAGASGDFVNVVSQIAGDCDLEAQSVEFTLINGTETNLGTELNRFTNSLSVSGLKKGDPSTSDLNQIFDKALAHAGNGNVSVLISDGIYSVNGSPSELLAKLQSQSILTRNNFIKRLREENLTTHLIKLKSNFSGYYYPAQRGQVRINQNRPYYIWVIGNSRDVQKIFPENYFENLPGFNNIVKFVKMKGQHPSCGLLIHNKKGSYRFNNVDLGLSNVEPRRLETAFSLAFDFSNIPLPSSYFDQLEVYENNLGYVATNVCHLEQLSSAAKASLQSCVKNSCTHIVTFEKSNAPWGTMNLQIKNLKPAWVAQTHDDDDSDIQGDEDKTFGFEYLIKGMNDAYVRVNNSDNLTEYKITINKN